MQKIKVCTQFDCTETGVRSYKRNNLSQEDWHFKRNQQRNWETLVQCISLRCQPLNINGPYVFSTSEGILTWNFSFETDRLGIFEIDSDPLGALLNDCNGVPMLIGLTENNPELFFTPYIITSGDVPNTVFTLDYGK